MGLRFYNQDGSRGNLRGRFVDSEYTSVFVSLDKNNLLSRETAWISLLEENFTVDVIGDGDVTSYDYSNTNLIVLGSEKENESSGSDLRSNGTFIGNLEIPVVFHSLTNIPDIIKQSFSGFGSTISANRYILPHPITDPFGTPGNVSMYTSNRTDPMIASNITNTTSIMYNSLSDSRPMGIVRDFSTHRVVWLSNRSAGLFNTTGEGIFKNSCLWAIGEPIT